MTASLRGLPACNTEACGLSQTAYRQSHDLGRISTIRVDAGKVSIGASGRSPCVAATEPTADRLLQPPALLDPPGHSLLGKPHVVDCLDTELRGSVPDASDRMVRSRMRSGFPGCPPD
jgi:hypothetical protein